VKIQRFGAGCCFSEFGLTNFSLGKHDRKWDKFIVIPITKQQSQHFFFGQVLAVTSK
jgi:hypothetical protein